MRSRIRFVLESRGIANSLERAGQVGSRFGFNASRMARRLARYADVVAEAGSGPSLPITARVLARNPRVAAELVARGVEMCVHGLVHNDLSRLPAETQVEQIEAACTLFRRHGIPFTGFRSPYLKYNAATLAAVEKAGFIYDSNLPFYWGPLRALSDIGARQRDGLERGLRFYQPRSHPEERSLPRFIGNLVEIPVSLPDDEILLDRMNLSPDRIGRTWVEMVEAALARGEILTLQLHPERLSILEGPLRDVLRTAAGPGRAWLASLGEVAAWWRTRTAASLTVSSTGGTHQIRASGAVPGGIGMVVPATGSHEAVRVPGVAACDARPLVGVSPETAPALRIKIRELGYFYDITADRGACATFIETGTEPGSIERLLAACNRPLLMEAVWPTPYRAALAVTGDIDCLTLGDFLRRFWRG